MSLLFPRVDSMNKSGYPTKICSSCGQKKPLSAFLQLAAPHSYGNICSDCRKSAIDSSETAKEQDESTRSTTGAKLDAKAKVQATADKREFSKQVDETYHEGRDKNEELNIDRLEKTSQTAADERKHREAQEKRKQEPQKKPHTEPASVHGGEEQKAEAGRVDLATGPVETSRVAGQAKVHSSFYQMHLTRLGASAPQNLNRDNKAAPTAPVVPTAPVATVQNTNNEKEPAKKNSLLPAFKSWLGNAPVVSSAEKIATQDKKNKAAPASDPASEYIHRNSGPKRS